MAEIIDISCSQKVATLPDSVLRLRLPHGADMVALEVALAEASLQNCLALVARYGRCPVFPRVCAQGEVRHYITVYDAIRINRKLLAEDYDSDRQLAARIDLVQMLENNDPGLHRPTSHAVQADARDAASKF